MPIENIFVKYINLRKKLDNAKIYKIVYMLIMFILEALVVV